MLSVRFFGQLKRFAIESPILTLLTVQLVDSCIEEGTPVPHIFADSELGSLNAWVALFLHGSVVCQRSRINVGPDLIRLGRL